MEHFPITTVQITTIGARIKLLNFRTEVKPGVQGDVRHVQNAARIQTMNKNRRILKSVTETILRCARQNIPFRGHRDSERIPPD